MQEYSKENKKLYERVRRLVYNLRGRYKNQCDLYIGILSILAGQKLLRNFYRTHKNRPDLLEWRAIIFDIIAEFQNTLNEYEIKGG